MVSFLSCDKRENREGGTFHFRWKCTNVTYFVCKLKVLRIRNEGEIAGRKYALEMEKIRIHKLCGTIQSHKVFCSPKLFASFDATEGFGPRINTKKTHSQILGVNARVPIEL